MNECQPSTKDVLRQEMMTHLADLRDRCADLLAARDPFSVYNSVMGLKSLVGQLESSSRRYRQIT